MLHYVSLIIDIYVLIVYYVISFVLIVFII